VSRTFQDIFQIQDQSTFRAFALEVFYYQARYTAVYRDYLAALGVKPSSVRTLEQIPFLPIEFFKSHTVIVEWKQAEVVFESSGTSGTNPSFHHVPDASLYHKSFTTAFRQFYGDPYNYCILALLPNYMERSGSSLVHMMEHLITGSGHPDSGFYLENLDELASLLRKRNEDRQATLLVGVSFALLDLAEQHPMALGDHIVVMETGGMKGRRTEMIRSELHETLRSAFGLETIHSEYGMTELLSQAYSRGDGLFHCPPWMKVLVRDPNDPLTLLPPGQTGGINVIDLANLNSCSFIATGDLGKTHEDGSFEVLGRFDHSDVRGCNLLVS
jgi:phenylacetate-coenzyme A ligase PaaK-like adenylate-forming protein